MNLVLAALAVAAGFAMSVQATANAGLSKLIALGPTLVLNSAFVLLGSVALWLATGASTTFLRADTSWTFYVGGLCGLLIIAVGAIVFPTLGAAWSVALMVFGQCIAALLIDHFGVMGMAVVAVTPQRVAGVALVAGGVAVLRL
jgi:transporter family-2 protein